MKLRRRLIRGGYSATRRARSGLSPSTARRAASRTRRGRTTSTSARSRTISELTSRISSALWRLRAIVRSRLICRMAWSILAAPPTTSARAIRRGSRRRRLANSRPRLQSGKGRSARRVSPITLPISRSVIRRPGKGMRRRVLTAAAAWFSAPARRTAPSSTAASPTPPAAASSTLPNPAAELPRRLSPGCLPPHLYKTGGRQRAGGLL